MRLTVAALMLIVLLACSNSQVKIEQDWNNDFTRYRTYAWSQGAPARDPSVESEIRAAVDFELPFKALERVETASLADLYVSTYASVGEPAGTLVINLVDARSGKLVWRGQAASALDHQVSEAKLRRVMRDIFRHYPWKD